MHSSRLLELPLCDMRQISSLLAIPKDYSIERLFSIFSMQFVIPVNTTNFYQSAGGSTSASSIGEKRSVNLESEENESMKRTLIFDPADKDQCGQTVNSNFHSRLLRFKS